MGKHIRCPTLHSRGNITKLNTAMKSVAAVAACLVVAAFAQTQEAPKFPPRELPADVLRDFPGMCFASTACRVFEIDQSWPLSPFCGKATCVQKPDGLKEVVEDCGPLPKPNPDCGIINQNAQNETYPDCCPVFECKPGVQLEYPTPEELAALAQQTAAAAQAQAQANSQVQQ